MKRADAALARQKAEELLRELGITALPVDPFAIAAGRNIIVQKKPDTAAKGVSGLLMRVGDAFGIMYATHIESDGFQRFSVAHELGHYFLPGHIDAVLTNGAHESRAGYVSDDPYEKEADHFAAGLLMPDRLFKSALIKASDGLEGIYELANLCGTSITATAIRYVDKASIPVAIVVSTGPRMDYAFLSTAMQDFPNLEWPRKGNPIPGGTLTDRFNRDQQNILQARRDTATSSLKDWFGYGRDVEVLEEVVGLGSYGKTLTVISSDTFADEDAEEESLEESWSPKFARGR